MNNFSYQLRKTVESATPRLLSLSNMQVAIRPGDGGWSVKELLGHLIDSAANNHRRFVEAQFRDDLVYPEYDQERWVEVQNYQSASWTDLIVLWKAYNLHLVHVVDGLSEETLRRPRHPHSLDQIGWNAADPVTLEDLMGDYLAHLHGHLRQIETLASALTQRQ
jgi:uncharacterized damage-inducible protein DinB